MHMIAFGFPGPAELTVILLVFLVAFVAPSLLVGFVAWNYGRSPVAWFLISLFATPLLAFIALALVGQVDPERHV